MHSLDPFVTWNVCLGSSPCLIPLVQYPHSIPYIVTEECRMCTVDSGFWPMPMSLKHLKPSCWPRFQSPLFKYRWQIFDYDLQSWLWLEIWSFVCSQHGLCCLAMFFIPGSADCAFMILHVLSANYSILCCTFSPLHSWNYVLVLQCEISFCSSGLVRTLQHHNRNFCWSHVAAWFNNWSCWLELTHNLLGSTQYIYIYVYYR